MKTGKSLEEDIERLHKIREKVGRQIPIRVDANQGYSWDEYVGFIQRTQILDLEFIEQPLKADDIERMQSMPKSGGRRFWTQKRRTHYNRQTGSGCNVKIVLLLLYW